MRKGTEWEYRPFLSEFMSRVSKIFGLTLTIARKGGDLADQGPF